MKVSVDQDLCISCGACIDICPETFEWNEDDKAHSKGEVPGDVEDQAKEAVESCPTSAINEL